MTLAERMQFKNKVQMILHAPGGPLADASHGGPKAGAARPQLEMTLIFDSNLSKETAASYGKEIITTLKQTDEIFRNVRLNAVRWISDENITRGVTAAPILQMGRYFEDYESQSCQKRLEVLMDYLKKFDARSRLLILITDGSYWVEEEETLQKSLNPFLYRKILVLEPAGIKTGRQLL